MSRVETPRYISLRTYLEASGQFDFASRRDLSRRFHIRLSDDAVGWYRGRRGGLAQQSTGDHIYNYDETNITDDPGARKFIVPRNCKRVERVQNFSRTALTIMVRGIASGDLLPPMVVYKASNFYENWWIGGPTGTVYKNSSSGWKPGNKVIVVGDNLASHFAPNVIQVALEHDIYLTLFPPNATHLMQPLDVAVFAAMKKKWRVILDAWRKETRYPGSIPKKQFPLLLNRL
ncbi:hypothetical protein NQ318_016170 [Aromia moschata]|uniref:DDE-1 domain-containing protein n=1 Tax=Aromia moschata TaxID=1265417 RepID=A0AAV8Y0Z9_9CUCU|nr:hypothetical protein NQ318_016170 [Aromia moschata]